MERNTAVLSTEDPMTELWLQYQGNKDTGLRNQLVLHYEGLVKSIALQVIRNRHVEQCLDDIIGEGLIALIDAVERYDPSYRVMFKMFASIKIKGAMLDYFRKETPGYKRRIAQKIHALQHTREELTRSLMREPTEQEMASAMQLTMEEYEKELSAIESVRLVSLDQIDWQQSSELMEPVDLGSFSNPEAAMGRKELVEMLSEKIRLLNEEQQMVLSLFYTQGLKINEIADVLGWDPVRVSQIRYQAVRRLKRSMKKYVEEG